MSNRIFYTFLALGITICLTPLGAVIWSDWFARKHGCILNEAGVNSCIVNGTDYGSVLALAFGSGWFLLITLPAAITMLIIGLGPVNTITYPRFQPIFT